MKNKLMLMLIIGIFVLIVVFVIFYFSSDYPQTPKSSEISRANGLLVADYKPSINKVIINGELYLIKDSWATYFFKNRKSKQINKDSYTFLLLLINQKTGNKCIYKGLDDKDFLKYKGPKYGYTNGIGIVSGFQAIDFISQKKPIPPEKIEINFKSFDSIIEVVFTKQ